MHIYVLISLTDILGSITGPQLALTVPSSRTGEVCLLITSYFSVTPPLLGLMKHKRTMKQTKQISNARTIIPIMKGSLS